MPSLDAYRWLIGDEAAHWLKKTADDLADKPPLPATVKALRSQLGAERAALVLQQVELQVKARAKFSHADQLVFTPRGLEQATDELLAAYKAQRFADCGKLVDLCCGIGGDAMSLSQDHSVDLVDRDEVSLLLAAANVERSGGMLADQSAASVKPEHVIDAAAWHIDPDRRSSGSRISRVEFGEPGLETIDALLAVCPDAAVKLAPAAEVPTHWGDTCQREWIETRGECRQQVAWFGRLAEGPQGTLATLIDASGESCSFGGAQNVFWEYAERVAAYLFDPSPSLLAAGLLGSLAQTLGLAALSTKSSYLTGDEAIVHPHLQSFAVEHQLPLDVRQLRSYLQARRVGRLEIKKRGVPITPETLRPKLTLSGDEEATLIIANLEGQTQAFVCRRI